MERKFTAGLVILLIMFWSMAAHATIITYADRSSFDSAFGGTTLIDFEAEQTGTVSYYGANLTVGDVSFTQARLLVLGPSVYSTSGTSNYLNNNSSDGAPVVINFSYDIYAVGMDLGWLNPWGGSGSTMNVILNNGESFSTNVVGPLHDTSTPLDFVGFSSDIAFSSITIDDLSNSVMIDNFAYTSSNVIPEPATFLLFGLGILGIAGVSRKKTA